jgi:hypothetical protein
VGREGRCRSAPGKKSFETVFVFALVKPELGTSDDELAMPEEAQNVRWKLQLGGFHGWLAPASWQV